MDYSGIYEAYQQIYEQPQVSPEDIFECVVNYLLDEGYCDSEESALLVAEAAGVDWILDIVEAADNTILWTRGPNGEIRHTNDAYSNRRRASENRGVIAQIRVDNRNNRNKNISTELANTRKRNIDILNGNNSDNELNGDNLDNGDNLENDGIYRQIHTRRKRSNPRG